MKARGEGDNRGWDGWLHHQLNGLEFEQASGDGKGQGRLVCCSPWGRKDLDTTWATEQQQLLQNLEARL